MCVHTFFKAGSRIFTSLDKFLKTGVGLGLQWFLALAVYFKTWGESRGGGCLF